MNDSHVFSQVNPKVGGRPQWPWERRYGHSLWISRGSVVDKSWDVNSGRQRVAGTAESRVSPARPGSAEDVERLLFGDRTGRRQRSVCRRRNRPQGLWKTIKVGRPTAVENRR